MHAGKPPLHGVRHERLLSRVKTRRSATVRMRLGVAIAEELMRRRRQGKRSIVWVSHRQRHVSIDAKRTGFDKWEVSSSGGRIPTGLDALEWAQRAVALGAGEIVLNSIDADGTKIGFDLAITHRISESVPVPVVASGGAGSLQHMADALREGRADAVLAPSICHFGRIHSW